jgi:hypothetical protein
MGLPDYIVKCKCSDEELKKRFMKAKEIEEFGEDHAEEVGKLHEAYVATEANWAAIANDNQGRVHVHDIDTEKDLDLTKKELDNLYSPRVILVNHEKALATDTPCSNLAIKHNLIYISVYQLIRHHIKNGTDYGRKLLETKKPKNIDLTAPQKDEFEEREFSAAHYDTQIVFDILKEKIKEVRSHQKYILIEGLCNSGKLMEEEDKLEIRYMDEFMQIESNIGKVQGVVSLQFKYEPEAIDPSEIVFEEFPEPSVHEKPVAMEGDEEEEAPPAEEEEEKKGKLIKFDCQNPLSRLKNTHGQFQTGSQGI